ncbi:hypothetical protein HMSSN036_89550 [Paenibacillus macerans]|nr:hypothetical protein HMSSN036_89550 [Paenibacillus macerans]
MAHFHYVIVGGLVLGLFAGLHYWWPKMFGRMLSERLGKVEFWTFIIGFHMTFFVQHFLGLMGMQRRVFTYLPNQGFDLLNLISTVGAFLMGVGVIVFLINVGITANSRKARQTILGKTDVRWNGRFLRRRRNTTSSKFRWCAGSTPSGKRKWPATRR